jgi:hypothetical protein
MTPIFKDHANRWLSQGFPCPFKHNDRATLKSLDKLYDQLHDRIQDNFARRWAYWFTVEDLYLGINDRKRDTLFFNRLDPIVKAHGVNGLSSLDKRQLYKFFLKLQVTGKFQRYLVEWFEWGKFRRVVHNAYPVDREGW